MSWYKFEIVNNQHGHTKMGADFARSLDPTINTGIISGLFKVQEMALYAEKHRGGTTYYVSPELAKASGVSIEKWKAVPCEMPNSQMVLFIVLGTDRWNLLSRD